MHVRDIIATSSINQVEVPYRLVIKNYDKIGSGAKQMADDFISETFQVTGWRSSLLRSSQD